MSLNSISGYGSLPLNKPYYWRICAVNSLGLSSPWAVESFVYGVLANDPVVIEPVTITDISVSDNMIRLEWTPTEQFVWLEWAPTLVPPQWELVNGTLNIKTNYFEMAVPPNTQKGFLRVMSAVRVNP